MKDPISVESLRATADKHQPIDWREEARYSIRTVGRLEVLFELEEGACAMGAKSYCHEVQVVQRGSAQVDLLPKMMPERKVLDCPFSHDRLLSGPKSKLFCPYISCGSGRDTVKR